MKLKMDSEGKRVCLRRIRLSDVPAIHALARHREVSRWTTNIPHPLSIEQTTTFVRRQARQIGKDQGYHFAIIERKTDELAGLVGLFDVERENNTAEIGYWLGVPHWGKGLMTEAVGLILDFAFTQAKLFRVFGTVFEGNPGSQQVMRKNGMVREGTFRKMMKRYGKRHDLLYFAILKEEWQERKKNA